jgi:transposase
MQRRKSSALPAPSGYYFTDVCYMRKSTNEKSEALILALHYQGKTIAEIATETGLNRSVIAQILFVRAGHRTEEKKALIDRIKAGIDPNLSLSANAKRLGVNILVVKAAFHDLGLKQKRTAPTKESPPTPTEETREQAKKILELQQKGLSYREIGKRLGISHEWARQIIQRYTRQD